MMALAGEATYTIVDGAIVITLPVADAHTVVQNSPPLTIDFKKMRATDLAADTSSEPANVPPSDLLNNCPNSPDGKDDQNAIHIERDDDYYLPMILFETEDYQFLVPRWRFSESTTHFDLVLSQGKTEDSVVALDNVSPDDFRGLMRIVYPLQKSKGWGRSIPSKQEWISALKLSTQWGMLQYRKQALAYLQADLAWTPKLSSAEDIVLGKACGVPTWYRRGCIAFVQGDIDLEAYHKDTLGIETMVKLMRARDKAHLPDVQSYCHRFSIRSHAYHDVLPSLFKDEARQTSSEMSPIERILMARNYGLSDWLLSCYNQLVEREDSISVEEAELLGLETTIKLWKARLELFRTYRRILLEQVEPPHLELDFLTAMEREFIDDFGEAQLLYDRLDPPPPEVPKLATAEPIVPSPGAVVRLKTKNKKKGLDLWI